MYKLMIESLSGVWRSADLSDDKPAMNYQANNLAELKDRQASYSQALKLPISQTNALIFGYSDTEDVEATEPYRRHNCRLFEDDYEIAGKWSFLVLMRVSDNFEVQILSGNADLFDLLGDAKMEDLDLGYIVREAAALNPSNFDGYEYALSTWFKGLSPVVDINTEFTFPFVRLDRIITEIVEQQGYTLETNLTTADWGNKALPVVTLKPKADSFEALDAGVSSFPRIPDTTVNGELFVFDPATLTTGAGRAWLEGGAFTFSYEAKETCRVRLRVSASWSETSGAYASTTPLLIEAQVGGVYLWPLSEASRPEVDQYVDLQEGEILRVSANLMGNPANQVNEATLTVQITDVVYDYVPLGGKLYLAENLGFDSQLDIFKAWVQIYGITVSVDNATKTVYAYTMSKVYDNKATAKDWSDKLHHIDRAMSFDLKTYAQRNYIRFADNDKDNVKDSGFFDVDNTILKAEKDLFSIPFEAGMDRYAAGQVGARLIVNPNPTEYPLIGVGWKATSYQNETLSGLRNLYWAENKSLVEYTLQAGDTVLLPNQSNPAENGLWVAASGAWSRSTALDTWAEHIGAYIEYHYEPGKRIFKCLALAGGTLGTTPLFFEMVHDDSMIFAEAEYVANIPVQEQTESTERKDEFVISYLEGKPHIVELSTNKIGFDVEELGLNLAYAVANHVPVQHFIDTYYSELSGSMLVKAKIIEAYFFLTAQDVETFDPFTPVWVERFGAFFYVNKINNYTSGELTRVELIKL